MHAEKAQGVGRGMALGEDGDGQGDTDGQTLKERETVTTPPGQAARTLCRTAIMFMPSRFKSSAGRVEQSKQASRYTEEPRVSIYVDSSGAGAILLVVELLSRVFAFVCMREGQAGGIDLGLPSGCAGGIGDF